MVGSNKPKRRSSIVLAVLFASAAVLFAWCNPSLLGLPCPEPDSNFKVYKSDGEYPSLDFHLHKYRKAIGGGSDDYVRLRNHCLRVLTFATHDLKRGGISKDRLKDAQNAMSLALAYHRIAVYTKGASNFPEPSAAVLAQDSKVKDEKRLALAKEMIFNQYKLTDWRGGEGADIVNAFRRAQWVDATHGVVAFGMGQGNLKATYDGIPSLGFNFLAIGSSATRSGSFFSRLEVVKILKL